MDSWVDLWQKTSSIWHQELGDLTQEAIVWQPFARSHSIGSILLHVADVESVWMREIVAGERRTEEERNLLLSNLNCPALMEWARPPEYSVAQYLVILDEVRRSSISICRRVNDLDAPFIGPNGETKTLCQIIAYLMTHEAYHLGQAVLHKIHYGWGGVEPA